MIHKLNSFNKDWHPNIWPPFTQIKTNKAQIEAYIEKIGLKEHLSPTRANGLVSMIKQIKYYALALS